MTMHILDRSFTNQRICFIDCETSGLSVDAGHRIIEVAALEVFNREITGKVFESRVNPCRAIDIEASQVHGISEDELKDEPKFEEIAEDLLQFLGDSPIFAHNARFDIRFLAHEYQLLATPVKFPAKNEVIDTIAVARRNGHLGSVKLDRLIEEYGITDSEDRELHSALKDSRYLAKVWLAMTAGQVAMSLVEHAEVADASSAAVAQSKESSYRVVQASEAELELHEQFLKKMAEQTDNEILYQRSSKEVNIAND